MKSISKATKILLVLGIIIQAKAQPMMLPLDWYPESIVHDNKGNLYVSSWHQGAVQKISKNSSTTLIKSGSNQLSNGQGILVDETRNLLWVCSGRSGFTTVPQYESALKSYQLSTGKPLQSYTMPNNGYCNDIAMDDKKRIYVTDSLNPQIVRLDSPKSSLQIWAKSPLFEGKAPLIGLNGIAIHQNNVYVSKVTATNGLASMEIDHIGQPQNIHWLTSERELKNVDSVRIVNNKQLLLAESDAFGNTGSLNGQITLATINETNQTLNLKNLASGLASPSSATSYKNKVYYIQSKYPLLLDSKGDLSKIPKNVPFTIEEISLK